MTDLASRPQSMPPPGVREQMDLGIPEASWVRKAWDDSVSEQLVLSREYSLNRAFDRGDQHISWSTSLQEAQIHDIVPGDHDKSRTTVNLFRTRRRSLGAKLTASELAFNVRASSPDDSGMRRQRLNTQILEYLRTRQHWERKRAQGVRFAMFGGVSAISWEWDPTSRNGPPVHDPLSQTLMPAPGVRLSVMSVNEFGVEAGSQYWEDATYWMRATSVPTKRAQATYGLDTEPPPDSTPKAGPMMRMLRNGAASSRGNAKLCTVYAFFRRPTSTAPGCVAHYIGDRPVAFGPWPFPHDDLLNLYVFACDEPDETWLTDPWLSDARSPQAMYNDVRSTIREHALRAANARILAPEGSLEDLSVFTDQPGEVIEYTGDKKPEWMNPATVERWLIGEVDRLAAEINDVMNSPDIARGVAPGDRNSGSALALLAEKADGPLGPFARDQARGWGVIATNVLRTLRHHMPEGEQRQTTVYSDSQSPTPQVWTRADIDEDVEVLVPVEVTEPRSFAATRAQLIELYRTMPALFEAIPPSTLARMLGLGDLRSALNEVDGQTFVIWENERLMAGIICAPEVWHDHNAHIRGHEQQRNSAAYELAPPQVQDLLDMHIDGHKSLAAEAMANAAAQQLRMEEAMPLPPEDQAQPKEESE